MQKREAKFTTEFMRWLKYNCKKYWTETHGANFEIKVSKQNGKSIPFSAVVEHQERNLLAQVIRWKISDFSREQKPYDCFVSIDKPGYVVLFYYRRGNKKFYIINIHDWVDKRETSSRKSLTEQEAESIAEIIGELA